MFQKKLDVEILNRGIKNLGEKSIIEDLESLHRKKRSDSNLLKNRNFMFLLSAQISSSIGFQMYLIAMPLLVYQLTNSGFIMSTVRAAEFLPNILLGVFIGILIDRIRRKKVMTIMLTLQITTLLILALLLYFDSLLVWHLYIVSFLLATAGFSFWAAQHSMIPNLVKKNDLTDANSKFSLVDSCINMLGPGLAGVIIAVYSLQTTFVLYATTSVA